jgi:hypothetical protein
MSPIDFSDIEKYLHDAVNRNEDETLWAIKKLKWSEPQESIRIYLNYILNPSPKIRIAILAALYDHLSDIDDYNLLIDKLDDLNKLVHDEHAEIRLNVFKILIFLDSHDIDIPELPKIIHVYLDDVNPNVRKEALKYSTLYLGIKPVIAKLWDPNERVLLQALKIIQSLNLELPKSIKPRLRVHSNIEVQLIYARIISKLAETNPIEHFDEVIGFLSSKLPFLESIAVETFTKIILQKREDKSNAAENQEKHEIFKPKGIFDKKDTKIEPKISKSDLISILEKLFLKNDEQVIIACLKSIGILELIEIKNKIIENLSSMSRKVRQVALETLSKIGSFEDFNFIIPLLSDPYFEIRNVVYEIFERRLDPRTIIPLIQHLQTAPQNEIRTICNILDHFNIDQILLPLLSIYRNNLNMHVYVKDKLTQFFPTIQSLTILKQLKNYSIPYLLDCLKLEEFQNIAKTILTGWGYRAYDPLQRKLESMRKSQVLEKASHIESILEDIIRNFENKYKITIQNGYSLLL